MEDEWIKIVKICKSYDADFKQETGATQWSEWWPPVDVQSNSRMYLELPELVVLSIFYIVGKKWYRKNKTD